MHEEQRGWGRNGVRGYQHRSHSYLSALVTLVTTGKKNTRGKLGKEGRGRGRGATQTQGGQAED